MCRTSQPPRRDMYQLETTMRTANTGGFSLPKKRKPARIGTGRNDGRIEVFNGNYSPSGERLGDFPQPWTVFTRWDARTFKTQPEALQWALQEARK